MVCKLLTDSFISSESVTFDRSCSYKSLFNEIVLCSLRSLIETLARTGLSF